MAIEAVEANLKSLAKTLAPLEKKDGKKTLDDDDRASLAALRKEKEQLRKEKEQLRKEKEQLREKELLLLKNPKSNPPVTPRQSKRNAGDGSNGDAAGERAAAFVALRRSDNSAETSHVSPVKREFPCRVLLVVLKTFLPVPPEGKVKLFAKGNILNRVYTAALKGGFTTDKFKVVDAETVLPKGAKVPLPKSVNVEVFRTVDLRLSHDNPLIGTGGELFNMRDDVIKVIDMPSFAHVLFIGSSGCGKTTTAFMLAKERYCIFLECWERGGSSSLQMYHLQASELQKIRGEDQFGTVQRRMTRQVLARCALLAMLHKLGKVKTPYEWLLLSISRNKEFADMLDSLLDVFDGTMPECGKILRAVAEQIGQRPCLIIDEAHLLVEEKPDIVLNKKKPDVTVDTFGAVACSITNFFRDELAACVWIGTQVRMEESAALVSAVYKVESPCVIYAFCSFPWVTRELFLEMAETILDGDHLAASLVLCGRPRALATWIHERIEYPKMDAGEALKSVVARSRLVDEIKSVRRQGLGDSDLCDLWMAAISFDEDGDCFCPKRYGGTLAFTSGFANELGLKNEHDFKTGGELEFSRRKHVAFVHRLDEPGLIDAIVEFFGPNAIEHLRGHAIVKCINFKREPSIRGQLLDIAVLCKVVSLPPETPLWKWLPLTDGDFKSIDSAKVSVSRIVSGGGVLYQWLEAVLNCPDKEFLPGVAARNVCVRPEHRAGADGVFAAFKGKVVVLVTVACAWYAEVVPTKKWEDQALRSSDLRKQFLTKTEAAVEAPKKKKKVEGDDLNTQIVELLGKKKPRFLRVLFELPKRQAKRKGKDAPGNVDGSVLVVNQDNVEKVLGSDIAREVKRKVK